MATVIVPVPGQDPELPEPALRRRFLSGRIHHAGSPTGRPGRPVGRSCVPVQVSRALATADSW